MTVEEGRRAVDVREGGRLGKRKVKESVRGEKRKDVFICPYALSL